MRADAREVKALALDLSKAPQRVQRNASSSLRRGAALVAQELRKDASGHDYLPHLAGTVSSGPVGPLVYEIGFDKGGQGSLAHIIIEGSVNNAPVFSNTDSLRRAMPAVVRMVADAGDDSVFGGAS